MITAYPNKKVCTQMRPYLNEDHTQIKTHHTQMNIPYTLIERLHPCVILTLISPHTSRLRKLKLTIYKS